MHLKTGNGFFTLMVIYQIVNPPHYIDNCCLEYFEVHLLIFLGELHINFLEHFTRDIINLMANNLEAKLIEFR